MRSAVNECSDVSEERTACVFRVTYLCSRESQSITLKMEEVLLSEMSEYTFTERRENISNVV